MAIIFPLFLGWFLISGKKYRNIDKGYEEVLNEKGREFRNSRNLRKVKNWKTKKLFLSKK